MPRARRWLVVLGPLAVVALAFIAYPVFRDVLARAPGQKENAAVVRVSPTTHLAGPSELASSTVTWDTGDGSVGLVCVSRDGAPKELFARGPSGSQVAEWIAPESAYLFSLHATADCASTAVVETAVGLQAPSPAIPEAGLLSPVIEARPAEVPAHPDLTSTSTIIWQAGSNVTVCVSRDGAEKAVFATGASGSEVATWIAAASTYEFSLHSDSDCSGQLLASTVVTGTSEQPPSFPFADEPLPDLLWRMAVSLRSTGTFAFVALGILVVPGLALLLALPAFRTWSPLDLLCLAPAVSFALLSLGLLWLSPWPLWGPATVWAVTALACLAILVQLLRRRRALPRGLAGWARDEGKAALCLGVLFLAVLGTRVFALGETLAPFGPDGVKHTMIVKMILDHRGLPSDYEPYAPLTTFAYNFGFHTIAAWFVWLTGAEEKQAVLVVGQVLNAAVVPGLYLLGKHLIGSQLVGLLAGALAGLLSPTPAIYFDAARYAHLAGLVVLPGALVLALAALKGGGSRTGPVVLAGLVLGGVGLGEIRIFIHGLLFLATWAGLGGVRMAWGAQWHRLRRAAWVGAVLLLVCGVAILPWLWRVWEVRPYVAGSWLTPAELEVAHRADQFALGFLLQVSSPWLLLLAAAGWLLAVVRGRAPLWQLGLWIGLLLLLPSLPPSLAYLGGNTNYDTVFIGLYLPASILGAWAASELIMRLQARAWRLAAALGIAGTFAWGISYQGSLITFSGLTIQPEEKRAFQWIREHTDPDALFLINSFLGFNGHYAVATDAGSWIPVETQRQVTAPMPNYGTERPADPVYPRRVRDLARTIYREVDSPRGRERLLREGVTHIFVGTRGGPIDPERLAQLPWYRVRYQQDGVWIFEVIRDGA